MRTRSRLVVGLIAVGLAATFLSLPGLTADDPARDPPKRARRKSEVARLRTEVEGLRAEVRRLTGMLEALNKKLDPRPAPASVTVRVVPSPVAPTSKPSAPSGQGELRVAETRELLAPGQPIRSVALSPDGRWAAAVGYSGAMHLWDLSTKREPTKIQLTMGSLNVAVFSPDCKTVYVGAGDGVSVVDVVAAKQVRTLSGAHSSVERLALSSDGKTLAAAGRTTVQFLDIATGQETKSAKVQLDSIRAIDLAPDGKLLCVGGYSNNSSTQVTYFVRLWDVDSGQNAFRLDHPVRTVFRGGRLSPDGRSIYLVGPDGSLTQWDVASEKLVRTFDRSATSVAVSADGKTLASATHDGTITLRDVASGRVLQSVTIDDHWPETIALSADGRSLVTFGTKHRVSLYRFATAAVSSTAATPKSASTAVPETKHGPKPVQQLRGHESFINTIAVSPDGKTVASGGHDYSLRLWNVETGEQLKNSKSTQSSGVVKDVAFLPDGKRLLVGGGLTRGMQRLAIWDVETWRPTVKFEGHDHTINTVAVSPDGNLAASGSNDATARIWDIATGKELHKLTAHTNAVLDIAFSSDGSTLATCSADGSLRLWDVSTGRELRKLPNYAQCIAFHPTKAQLVTGSGMIELWDYDKAARVRSLVGSTRSVGELCISAIGDRLLSAGRDGEVRLLNLDAGTTMLKVPAGDATHPSPVAFALQGRRVLTVSTENTIDVWAAP